MKRVLADSRSRRIRNAKVEGPDPLLRARVQPQRYLQPLGAQDQPRYCWCNSCQGIVWRFKSLQTALRSVKRAEPATAIPGLSRRSGAWNLAPCPAMLRSMQSRNRTLQTVKTVESGSFRSDSGLSAFIEILAREAARSFTTREGAQSRMAAPDASTITKRPSPQISPCATAHSPKQRASSGPTNMEGDARLPAGHQGRLFD